MSLIILLRLKIAIKKNKHYLLIIINNIFKGSNQSDTDTDKL